MRAIHGLCFLIAAGCAPVLADVNDKGGAAADTGGADGAGDGAGDGGAGDGAADGGAGDGAADGGASDGTGDGGADGGGGDGTDPVENPAAGDWAGEFAIETATDGWGGGIPPCGGEILATVTVDGELDGGGECAFDSWFSVPVTVEGTVDADGRFTGVAILTTDWFEATLDASGALAEGDMLALRFAGETVLESDWGDQQMSFEGAAELWR